MQGPNYCWHVDGLDKLKTYGFAIHGCIDGYMELNCEMIVSNGVMIQVFQKNALAPGSHNKQ